MTVRSPSRFRGIAKWAGALSCLFLTVAFIISVQTPFAWVGKRGFFGVGGAALFVGWFHRDWSAERGLGFQYPNDSNGGETVRYIWWPKAERLRAAAGIVPPTYMVTIPIWLAFLLIAPTTVVLFLRDRRPPSSCKRCWYNLTGNTTGICPECGTNVWD